MSGNGAAQADVDENPPCAVCGRVPADMRHITVECFYLVSEFVPEARQETRFVEVPEEGTYLGYTRRYSGGTRDHWRSEVTAPNSSRAWAEQVPFEPPTIRLNEVHHYTVNCCKSCRADFLGVFRAWYRGDFRNGRADSEGNVALTEEEARGLAVWRDG